MKKGKKFLAVLLVMALEVGIFCFLGKGTETKATIIPYSGISSYYMAGTYYDELKKALYHYCNDSQPNRLVEIALSQYGYTSGTSRTDIAGNGNGKGKYCEFSEWISSQYPKNGSKRGLDWCASFVSWCAYMAGIPTSIIPHSAGAGTYRSCGTQHKIWSSDFKTYIDYQPKKGDLMLAMPYTKTSSGQYKHYNGYDLTAHVAIVAEDGWGYTESKGWTFTTIERHGNQVGSRELFTKISAASPAESGTHYIQMFVTPNYKIPDRWAPSEGSISVYSSDYKVGHEVKITPNSKDAAYFTLSVRDVNNKVLYEKKDFTGSVSFYPEYNGKYVIHCDVVSSSGGYLGLESTFTIQESGGFSGDAPTVTPTVTPIVTPVVQECSHQWENVSVENPATVFSEGAMLQKCLKCGETQMAIIPKLEPTISLNASVLNLEYGEIFDLTVSNLANGDYVLSVASSDNTVVRVESNFRIIAGQINGSADITVTLASGKNSVIPVNVVKPASTGSVLNIVINGKNKIAVGANVQYDASVTVSGDADKSVGWRSEDTGIAVVSESGLVSGIKPGKTVIYAKSSDGNIEASQIIYVVPKKNSSFKAYLGGTKQIDTYWEKQEGVSGYQIQYSTSSSFSSKKSKTLDESKTSYSFKVSKKKTYYVRIRSYILIGSEKYYGAWKKVKIKVK